MPAALTSGLPGAARKSLCPVTKMEEKAEGPEEGQENDGDGGVDARGERVLQGAINSLLIPNNSDYTDE